MKTHILGLYTVIYHVADLAKAKDWYTHLLGKEPYFDQPFYVGFNVAGHELGLLPQAGSTRPGRDCIAYWGVADIEDAKATLIEKGMTLFEPVTDVGEGIKVASFLDGDENIVGIIENPHYPDTCHK